MNKARPITFPSFSKLDGREFHNILVSADFLSLGINTARSKCSSQFFMDAEEVLLLIEVLADFEGRPIPILFVLEVVLSSELSYLIYRTGEACQRRKRKKAE